MSIRKMFNLQITFVSILFVCLCGCIPPSSNMNMISLGLSKQQVIEILGEPVSTTATYTNEYLNYAFAEGCRVSIPTVRCPLSPYFVRIINGKVDAYGRSGDFGTMQVIPQKNIIE